MLLRIALTILFLGKTYVLAKELALKRYISNQFTPSSDHPLLHFTLNNEDGKVYISAVNRLYQLDKTMEIRSMIEVETGPVNDSQECLPYLNSCEGKAVERVNNYNKLMVIDAQKGRLLVCGSVYQGLCEARSLTNIAEVVSKTYCQGEERCANLPFLSCLDEKCTTIAVIAEGPTVNNNVLYVATTTVFSSIYRKEQPYSVSTRSLDIDPTRENDLFFPTIQSLRQESFAELDETPYIKYFRYGFATDGLNGFVYFLYHKIHKTTGTNTSTIARVCKKDPLFNSYIELNLTCNGVSQEVNGELVDAFYQKDVGMAGDFELENTNQGALYILYKRGTSSSLCIYTISDLNKVFNDTIISCYRQHGKDPETDETVVTAVSKSRNKCDKQEWMGGADTTLDDAVVTTDQTPQLDYYEDYQIERGTYLCGAQYLPSLLARIPEVESTLSYPLDDIRVSGITVDLVDGVNVAHIGTEGGEIVQLDVNNKNKFNTINIGKPLLQDLTLDKEASGSLPHLYAMTSTEVYHIKVSICDRHTTCSDCLGARDPYCGWCILESKCMPVSSGCTTNSWLKPLTEQCIEATVTEPLERTEQQDATINVTLLPDLSSSGSYSCVFNGDRSRSVPARIVSRTSKLCVISCPSPQSNSLPASIQDEDYVNISLSMYYNDAVNIVSTTATFYECMAHGSKINRFQPCQSCIENRWGNRCAWCIESHACVPSATRSCVTSTENCPMVTSATENYQLLPVGVPADILLEVDNLPSSAGSEMFCHVQIENEKLTELKAVIVDASRDQVRCSSNTKLRYSAQQTEVPANITLYWEQGHIVDVSRFNLISFYNTTIEFGDCSLCVAADPKYKSGWCSSSNNCALQQLCTGSDWVTEADRCPQPEITSISPTSGPINGNTRLTITGTNMGVDVSEVQSVTVVGIPCRIQQEDFKISNQIVCITGQATTNISGKVSVTVRGFTKTSSQDFSYRNQGNFKVDWKEGPVSGGTLITISGTNLNTGYKKEARFGDNPIYGPSCIIKESLPSSSVIKCITEAATRPIRNLTLCVIIDDFPVCLPNMFTYLEDPSISSVTTKSGQASYLAGGREISITGERLNIIQRPRLMAIISEDPTSPQNSKRRRRRTVKRVVHYMIFGRRFKRSTGVQSFSSDCFIIDGKHMTCPSPEIKLSKDIGSTKNASSTMNVKAKLRLFLDNGNILLSNASLTYYPDPIVENLDKSQSEGVRNATLLDVKVQNLRPDVVTDEEINVTIGDSRCVVEKVDYSKGFSCRVPRKPKDHENSYPMKVKIGYKTWFIGDMSYASDQVISESLKTGLILSGVIAFILVIVCVVFCARKQRHYKENKNDFKKTIENLEMSVRADFRKAFAELSIDMTDLTADIGDVGLPILSYRQYATNMFFPSVKYHLCMKEPDPTERPIPAVQQGFAQFDLLITNKQFLMSFIHTLEQQRGFSNRDKGNVASLITVVLHKKLDYFTEVMKSLMSELVETSVQRNPKLVLRRTESVAERMFSNWVAICLFPYIRDKAGKPLFLLQKAIKHQVSKGALDCETGKTRYTLSDDSLLKEDIPCEPLTLFVSQSESGSDEPLIVKVLSCDSISQVKEKIMDTVYKRIPFSQRPKTEQLDLEWRHGRSGHLVLPDRDFVTEQTSRWKRVMTIKDYKVENNATMALVKRQQKHDDIVTQYTNQSADTSAISPMLPEENVKIYHLVKYTDDIEQKRESSILRDKHKHIMDLYLLRLINMKGILQSYVDEVFQAILDSSSIPPAVKHFFDFLDELAKKNGVEDEEILHIWKTNSVLGRYWVTILKNPEAVFDIDKPDSVESSMAVISQTYIDACSVQEHKPTKDSPINKQLYAKEIPTYKRMVQKYYQDVKGLQPVSDQDMSAHMSELSRSYNLEFDVHAAHNELWGYVNKYYEEIQETLGNDPNATQMVIQRLQQAYTLIDSSINNP